MLLIITDEEMLIIAKTLVYDDVSLLMGFVL